MQIGKQRGFTLIAVMAACLLLALATQSVMFVLSTQAQREREARLLRIGQEFVRAIGAYYESSPGSAKQFPATLTDLLEDRRFVGVKRHLRQIYEDPMMGNIDWGLVRTIDGGISGIYSRNEQSPIRSGALDWDELHLPAAAKYMDWRFVYLPQEKSL